MSTHALGERTEIVCGPDCISDDAAVWGYYPNNNYGSSTFLAVGMEWNSAWRSYIRFDLTDCIPPGATILAAELQITTTQANNASNYRVDIHRALSTWSENTVTWNNKPPIGSVLDYVYCWGASQEIAFNVTNTVRDWYLNPSENRGFCLKGNAESGTTAYFFKSKEANASWDDYKARLVITADLPPSLPDLLCDFGPQPDSGEPPSPWNLGQSVRFAVAVQNEGTAISQPCLVGFYVGISPDDYSDLRCVDDLVALEPSFGRILSCPIRFRPQDEGFRYLNVWIDYEGVVPELNEENNRCSYGPFYVNNQTLDIDKLGPFNAQHQQHVLYYWDENTNSCHDPYESFQTSPGAGWTLSLDNSCWMASAVNLLEYSDIPNSYSTWLRDGCGSMPYSDPWNPSNPVPCDGTAMTLDDPGFAHWALLHPGGHICGPIWASPSTGGSWNRNPIYWCLDRIAAGYPVGIGVFWGSPRMDPRMGEGKLTSPSGRHALTLWSIDEGQGTVILTDSDDGFAGPFEAEYTYSGGIWSIMFSGSVVTKVYYAASLRGTDHCLPDLVSQEVTWSPPSPFEGEPITVSFVVRNQGESLAPVSDAAVYVDNEVVCSAILTPDLYINGSVLLQCEIPGLSHGIHVIRVCADDSNMVNESNEDNNCVEMQIEIQPSPSHVDEVGDLPLHIELAGTPNPSRGPIVLRFGIPESAGGLPVALDVFDTGGRVVRNVYHGSGKPGHHTVVWDGSASSGRRAPAGVYFARLRVGKKSEATQLLLMD